MYQEPQLIEMAPNSDRRRYLWVMEPELGHISGAAFEISRSAQCRAASEQVAREMFESECELWRLEMLWRAEHGQYVPEGSDWEAFL